MLLLRKGDEEILPKTKMIHQLTNSLQRGEMCFNEVAEMKEVSLQNPKIEILVVSSIQLLWLKQKVFLVNSATH